MRRSARLARLAPLIACLLPALAVAAGQSTAAVDAAAAPPPPIVLRVDDGTVMSSSGGDFVPAATGTPLQAGDRIMVAENARASVFFDDRCFTTYDSPGVYVVERRCDGAAAPAAGNARTVGIVAGVVALGALAAGGGGGGDDDAPPPPVSR